MPETIAWAIVVLAIGGLARDAVLKLARMRIEQHDAEEVSALQERIQVLENKVNGLVMKGTRR